MSKIQAVIDRGILEEDPEGIIYLSAKMRDIVIAIQKDDTMMTKIKERATDEDEAQIGFWTLALIAYCGDASVEELDDGVAALVGWHQGARETRLDEWSMKLRFRSNK